jgi:murein L,D-transpeptidase YafK
MQPDAGSAYRLVHRYPICRYSGQLGPKTRQGDGQAPEGFYTVGIGQLNPASSYHLSFNLGYPNAYERAHGYTGDYLMVHGNCVSIGCYAMGDAAIEEIYTLVAAALQGGQARVAVHAFPFKLDAVNEAARLASPHADFWAQLAAGYRAFEATRLPPTIRVREKRYEVVSEPS